MSSNRFLIVLIIIFFYFSHQVLTNKEGMYLIVAPGTVRSDSSMHMSIALNNFRNSCWFNISLKSSEDSRNGHFERLHGFQLVEVLPNSVKLVELRVDSLYGKRGRLEVSGYRGIKSRDSAHINFEHNSYSVFIQTNKPKYKPGELVEFRVICIDHLTRPAQIIDQKIFVLIYDSKDYLMKHIADVKLVKGVFKGKFQISDSPVLGDWKIKIEIGGDAAAEKSFQVAKYVLPIFSVRILTKSNVAYAENKIAMAISASYFYGEPVKGNLTLLLKNTYSVLQDQELPTVVRKQSQINENAPIIIDMKNDLKIENSFENTGSYVLYKYEVTATVTDAMTEQQSEAKMEISIHSQPNKIILQAPKVFDPDTNIEFKVKVSITDLDDKPIEDKGSPIKIIIECNSGSELTSLGYEPVKTEFTHHIGKDPSIKLENRNFSECSLYAEYEGVRSRSEIIQKNVDTFFLDVLTESPEVGKKLLMKLKSSDPIDHFSYDIVSRGDIIQSTHVKVPDNQKIHIFGFDVTYAMVPKITVYVHRVDSRIFAGQIKDIFIKRAFQNSIQITTDEEAKPGSLVNINVTTDKNSYVGLMALDHRILQGINSLDDLTEDHFYTKLRNYDASSIDTSSFPGIKAGLITFTNAFTKLGTRFGEDDIIPIFGILPQDRDENLPEQFDKPSLEFPRLRKLFSESWLYKDFENTPAEGLNLMETAPDAITSWAITGFSLNPTTGLTLTKKATNFKVFQDFFVSIDLPNSVKEGETVEVPIYISNYMKKDAMTNVMIEKHSDNIEIFKTPDTVLKPKEALSKLVPAGKREKVLVFLKPLKSGLHNVTVKALSPMASDAILKTLSVKSDGVPYEISKTHLIHLPEEGSDEKEITIDIPPNAVAGSQSVELSIAGDVFRPLLASLQKNARVPYGNGEDNMRFIISNSLVLEYHKVLNHTSPSLENKIKLYLEIGYQNQQCFQHLDGSFGLFDKKTERSGDIWQTAFALWGLRQSKKFIKIDSKVFERGLKYLKERQEESGGFTSREGIKKDLEYTAFIVIVFLMDNDWRTAHNDVIFKGLNYLYEKSNNLEQSSVSVLSTYVLLLGRHEKARERVKQLTKTASLKNKKMLWEGVDTVQSHLETTADCLMNLFESNKKVRQNFHIIQGLIASDDGKTSLTHMIALHAMIILVDGLNLSRTNLSILYKEEDQRKFGKFQVNSENSQMIPTFKLSEKSQKIKFQSKGYGFAVVDVKYKYNLVNDVESSSSYAANITILKTTNYLTVFKVCASDFRNDDEHHLTVMEVNLQSGYIFTERATPDVGLTWKFKSIKVDPSQDKVVVYIENLNKIGNCLNLEALKKYNVINAKPGWVVLYDTHKRDEKIAKSFKLNES